MLLAYYDVCLLSFAKGMENHFVVEIICYSLRKELVLVLGEKAVGVVDDVENKWWLLKQIFTSLVLV